MYTMIYIWPNIRRPKKVIGKKIYITRKYVRVIYILRAEGNNRNFVIDKNKLDFKDYSFTQIKKSFSNIETILVFSMIPHDELKNFLSDRNLLL